MLEYSVDNAEALLEKNQTAATKSLQQVETDLDFIRDQYTTTEVSILYIDVIILLVGCSGMTRLVYTNGGGGSMVLGAINQTAIHSHLFGKCCFIFGKHIWKSAGLPRGSKPSQD